jgi:Zn-dependent oligopeptidase
MRTLTLITFLIVLLGSCSHQETTDKSNNPFLVDLNEPVKYHLVTADHMREYVNLTIDQTMEAAAEIRNSKKVNFDNVLVALDDIANNVGKARNNAYLLFWVSPDSASRAVGRRAYQELDSLSNLLYADRTIYQRVIDFKKSENYQELAGHRKNLTDEVIQVFEQSGVGLDDQSVERFQQLDKEIEDLTSQYSINMNTANEVLRLDEEGAEGLPENFKKRYEKEDGSYEIPVIPSTRGPVVNNATKEETRKEFATKYSTRAADKNLEILDQLVQKRYEIGRLMGKESFAAHQLTTRMANNPDRVWEFITDLNEMGKEKAAQDLVLIKSIRDGEIITDRSEPIKPWNFSFYRNQYLKNEYQVDHEKIREFLPMEQCLSGMMDIYQKLLDLEFRKVPNASVWHEEVELYEVFERGALKGRFYLDLFPRPNKEGWYYGVPIIRGKMTPQGYEIPTSMLLGNFTGPTEDMPSLISHGELRILFHEFGHIMNGMSYKGEFVTQAGSKSDFSEAMSQIFENWIWDYEMLSTFASHYQTGEVLPRETFDNMLSAKNITSGISLQLSMRACMYDMTLYDKYDPKNPISTDEIWRQLDQQMVMPSYIEGTHPQASWIHINTHPVYMYGYTWSRVYAMDMFTEFEKNGMTDTKTGKRYRELILANGTQRDIDEAVEEFLGRPMNNEAYIRSQGL